MTLAQMAVRTAVLLCAPLLTCGASSAVELKADSVEYRQVRVGWTPPQVHRSSAVPPSIAAATLPSEHASTLHETESTHDAGPAVEPELGSLAIAALGWVLFVARRRL